MLPHALAALLTITAAACETSDDRAATDTQAGAAADTSPMAGMPRGGMMGGAMSAMMDSMHTHMQMMDTMSASSMQAMLPMHRQMVGNVLSQMNAEMRQMNMPADTAWNATLDSVRQDLTGMPEMSGQQLRDMMPAHHARLTRLMQMHRDMMSRMQ
jgi:hypothetical protein